MLTARWRGWRSTLEWMKVNSPKSAVISDEVKGLASASVARTMLDTSASASYPWTMEIHLSPERQEELNDYAQRHGQDPAIALDDVLAAALEWERQDYQEAVEGIRRGYADLKAGRVRPIEECFEELRVKHGLPR